MKSLRKYLEECGSGCCSGDCGSGDCVCGPQTVAEPAGTLTGRKDPYAGALSGFGKPKKFGKEQRKRKFKNLRESFTQYNKFLKVWDLKGWFWHAFYPYTGNQNLVEEFCNILDTKGFSVSENKKTLPGKEKYPQPEKEVKLLHELFESEPKLQAIMGECLDQFCVNIQEDKNIFNNTGIEFTNPGELYQISESITWQDILDEKPMQTADGRKIFITKLIYSEEQIQGQITDPDKGVINVVWNNKGKCIQKRDEDDEYDIKITDKDSLNLL